MRTDSCVVMGLTLCLLAVSPVGAIGNARAAAVAGRARERSPSRPMGPPLGAEALDKLRELLAGADEGALTTATQALVQSGSANAALPLVEMLAVGSPPAATVVAIDALKKLHDPSAIEVLILYCGNRSADTRRHAVQALGVFADARVVPTLMERLGDSAPDVRAAAAEALATRNEKSAVPRLLVLMKRNDAGAAAPWGTLAPISSVPAVAELQGSIDDENLGTALGQLLKRHDVPEAARVDIIKTLARVPGASSTTALVEYVGDLPANDRRASRSEAQKVIDERGKQK